MAIAELQFPVYEKRRPIRITCKYFRIYLGNCWAIISNLITKPPTGLSFIKKASRKLRLRAEITGVS